MHVEPIEDADLRERAHAAAVGVPRVREVHNLALVDVDGRTELSLHVKLPGELSLEEAHEIAEQLEAAICAAVPEIAGVQTHLEPLDGDAARRARWRRRTRRSCGASCSEATGSRAARAALPAHRRGARRVPHARPRRHEPARRGARAGERDRGAHPSRAAGHRRRDSSYTKP